MSSDRPASLPSLPRRWRLSRKSRYFALLVAISIAGYWLLPWIFIPADLRAMQGTWKVLELQGDGEEAPENATIIISGNRVALRDDPADSERITATYAIELHSARREMRLHPPQEIAVVGGKASLPLWLWHSHDFVLFNYELDDKRLALHLQFGDGKSRTVILRRQ